MSLSRRDRLRSELRAEIHAAAYAQIAIGGANAISLNAIAKTLGMAGPSLYRHVASRDQLLAELTRESIGENAAIVAEVVAQTRGRPAAERLRILLWRQWKWAEANPGKHELATDIAGLRRVIDPESAVPMANRNLNVILELLDQTEWQQRRDPPPAPALATALTRFGEARGRGELHPAVLALGLRIWTRLHGLIDLRAKGVFAAAGLPADDLFAAEVEQLLDTHS